MLKKLILLFVLFSITNISFAEDVGQSGIISKEERCAIAKENLRALSDLSKPIYQRDDKGKLIELTYAQILEQRRQNQQLIASLCNISKDIRIQKYFYSNALNRAKTAAGARTQTSVDLALRQALINRDFDEVYTILVYVEGIQKRYANEFIRLAKVKTVEQAIVLYNEKYKDKSQSNDKTAKSLQDKINDILQGTTPGRKTRGRANQYDKKGDFKTAKKDFKHLEPKNIKDRGANVTTGVLSDGRNVNVRPKSSGDGFPTLEIQNPNGSSIKIRYKGK